MTEGLVSTRHHEGTAKRRDLEPGLPGFPKLTNPRATELMSRSPRHPEDAGPHPARAPPPDSLSSWGLTPLREPG